MQPTKHIHLYSRKARIIFTYPAKTLTVKLSEQMAQSLELQEDSNNLSQPENRPSNTIQDGQASPSLAAPSKIKKLSGKQLATRKSSDQQNLVDQQSPANKLQPSKLFLSKCQKELESLLDTVKKDYHEELKDLFVKETHPDLFVTLGEVKKPLHKCIVASRAYKLYCALRAFSVECVPLEKDIIVSDFQQKFEQRPDLDSPKVLDPEQRDLDLSILDCSIPQDLFTPQFFASFARRIYLDQDISCEEEALNKKIIDWLKDNRPELIKASPKHSPDNRHSFRTVQPDFEQSQTVEKCATMTPELRANIGEDVGSLAEEMDNDLRLTGDRDDSLNYTTLTRTDTFELISKNSNQGSSPSTPVRRNSQADTDDDKSDKADSTKEATESLLRNAPTTRTGLKPRTFTSPVGSNTGSAISKNNASTSESQDQLATKQSKSTQAKGSAKVKAPLNPPNSMKKSGSDSSSTMSKLIEQRGARSSLTVKTTTPMQSKSKTPSALPRAHPISLERSQSPGTSVIKGTGKNFISSNKRMISQIEKKHHNQQNVSQSIDSDADLSESSLYLVESLTSDNMLSYMDKFTLVSRSRLADALARLFIDGKMADAIVKVRDGRQLEAHLCILATRSAYLAEVIEKTLSKESRQESGQVRLEIDLSEFSFNSVKFSLLHIYSGAVKIPEDIELEELTRLSHLLHVTTLSQVCVHNLKMNLCHYFHKPCAVCCLGVLKTLPLAWRYDYSDLYSRCLQWIGSNFASIFCLKEFSDLKPQDLVEECYNATLSQLTPDNIITKTIECQRLLKNLPRVKWTESIICLVGRQLEDFCHYVASNYEKILQSESFLNLSKNYWECEILEENLLAAMNHLKPDTGCRTLIQLHKIECSIESAVDSVNTRDSFANMVVKMRKYCERYLLKDAAAVVHCSSWRHMSPSLQKRIKDQAIIMTDFDEPTKQLASKPKLPSMSRVGRKSSSPSTGTSSDTTVGSLSNRSTPESRLKSPNTTFLPPPKSKVAAARHVKILK